MSIFKGLSPDPRNVQAPPGSTSAELLALPQQREHTHDMEGMILFFPRTRIIGVPYKANRASWTVVVVDGSFGPRKDDGREVYPRGGHHIDVSDLEMQTAIELGPVRHNESRGIMKPGVSLLYATVGSGGNDYERFEARSEWIRVDREVSW